MSEQVTTAVPESDIVATGGAYYRRMRYIVAGILVITAVWLAYDGWVNWPAMNRKYTEITNQIDEATRQIESSDDKPAKDRMEHARENLIQERKDLKFHDDLAILLQKILTFALPVLGGALVMWAHHNSRGEIRLTHDTLTAPGHPPVHLDQIVALDTRLWDKKDIAYVDYDVPPAKGRIKLDAFLYETDPIVKIYERIEALMKEDAEAGNAHAQEESPPS